MRLQWTFNLHDTVFIFIIYNAFSTKKGYYICVSDENFGQYHARDLNCPWRDAARDLRLVRDFLLFSNKKTIFTSSDMYLNICGKSLTCVFIFCLKKIRKKYLFLVLDKETPLIKSENIKYFWGRVALDVFNHVRVKKQLAFLET